MFHSNSVICLNSIITFRIVIFNKIILILIILLKHNELKILLNMKKMC